MHQHDRQTDGRTDTGRQQRPRLRIASRGKNDGPVHGTAVMKERYGEGGNLQDMTVFRPCDVVISSLLFVPMLLSLKTYVFAVGDV